MEFKKSELTGFAKECARAAYYMLLGTCYAEEIAHSDLGRKISSKRYEEELLQKKCFTTAGSVIKNTGKNVKKSVLMICLSVTDSSVNIMG